MNGENYFNLVVCSSSRRDVVKTRKDVTIKKALDPILKRWGYHDVSKVKPQLRYYEFELKPQTLAGDTAGMEVFIKSEDSVDIILGGFHPFINKASLKGFTQEYIKLDGWYMTRESSSGDGQLSLAVTFSNQLRHFKINFSQTEATYKIACKSFDNLHQLIDYYKDHPLKKTPEGEVFLLHPILGTKKSDTPEQPSSVSRPSNSGDRPLPSIPTHVVTPKYNTLPRKPSLELVNGVKPVNPKDRPLPPIPPLNEPAPQLQKPNIITSKPKPDIPTKKVINNYSTKPKPGLKPRPEFQISTKNVNERKPNFRKESGSVFDQNNSSLNSPLSLTPRASPKPALNSPLTNSNNNSVEIPPALPSRDSKSNSVSKPGSFDSYPTIQQNINFNDNKRPDDSLAKRDSFDKIKLQDPSITPHPKTTPAPPLALENNLPYPWTQVYSNSQAKYYYYNPVTNKTSWKFPRTNQLVEKKPSQSISSNAELTRDPPMRQRSVSTIEKPRHRRALSPDKQTDLVFGEITEERKFNRSAPSPPLFRQSSNPKPIATNKRVDSNYDTLASASSHSPSNSNHVTGPFLARRDSKPRESPLNLTKYSDPVISSSPSVSNTSPVHNAPTGKSVKVGRHTIPAPPPNIPPTFSTDSAPPVVNNNNNIKQSKFNTLPHNNRNNLLNSIQGFKQQQLRPVTPDRSCSPSDDTSNTLLGVLRIRMERRNDMIQDSDESDFENPDDDW